MISQILKSYNEERRILGQLRIYVFLFTILAKIIIVFPTSFHFSLLIIEYRAITTPIPHTSIISYYQPFLVPLCLNSRAEAAMVPAVW